MTVDREHKLVKEYIETSAELAKLKANATEKQKLVDKLRDDIIDMLNEEEKTATAKYEGLGSISLVSAKVRVNQRKDLQPQLFEYLRSIGREDIISESANSSSLSVLVKEMLAEGKAVPEFIPYYLQPSIRINKI